jgi:cellulose synthase (UDP-forming)
LSEKGAPKKRARKILFIASTLVSSVYVAWRVFFTLPANFGPVAFAFGAMLIVTEAVAVLELALEFWQFMRSAEPELPEIPDGDFPHVDVLIATHDESPELLYKTINACTRLRYPDAEKVHVFVCDDSDRPAAAALAKSFGVGYFGISGNSQAKAGNLNNALSRTSSPLILTLDADMIPKSDILLRTAPYFFLPSMKKTDGGKWVQRGAGELAAAEKIGFVQTPQSFYNPDLFQYNLYSERNVPNEQDFFFREVNVWRNATNSALYAGSNTLISREALIDAGNIATGSITEDFETGIMIQAKGYRTYAISEALAQGLAPTSVHSLVNQRVRWARGCIQSLRNVRLLSNKELPARTKLGYFATLLYWWTFARRFVYILSPILFSAFSLRVVECSFAGIALFWLPHFLLQTAAIAALSNKIRNQGWSNVIDTILFPYMVGPVIMESVGIRQKKFVVTRKDGRGEKRLSLQLYAAPHVIMLALCVLSIARCAMRAAESGALYDALIIFWLAVNVKNLLFAIRFMLGRPNFRKAERFSAALPAELKYGGRNLRGVTCDLSETGLAVLLDRPGYVPPGDEFAVFLSDSANSLACELQCSLAHVASSGGRWKYSARVVSMEERAKRAYFQMIFDRDHPLPKTLASSASPFRRLAAAIGVVVGASLQSLRKLPRVPFGRSDAAGTGGLRRQRARSRLRLRKRRRRRALRRERARQSRRRR